MKLEHLAAILPGESDPWTRFRRRFLVDQQRKTTVVVDEFFRYPVDVVVDEGNNSSKVLIGVVDEKTIPQRFR